MNYQEAYKKLEKYGQLHVLKYYEELGEEEREALLTQIEQTDFDVLSLCEKKETLNPRGKIEPIVVMQLPEIAEKKEIPCIVRNLTDDEAIIIMVDSNLQREQILPSEKAFAYKMKLDAMKRQGKRTDLTSVPLAQKSQGKTSRQLLGEQVGESQDQIRRYIRLTELITPILDMVDSGKIAIRPAVELSYLPKEQQTILLDTMQLEDCTPSHAQAIKMRKFADEGRLNEDVILSILSEEKGNQKEQFRMPKERISKYFSPGTPAKQMEDTIVKALELYRKRERSKDRER